jgi:hypothetical protein
MSIWFSTIGSYVWAVDAQDAIVLAARRHQCVTTASIQGSIQACEKTFEALKVCCSEAGVRQI